MIRVSFSNDGMSDQERNCDVFVFSIKFVNRKQEIY